MVRSEGKKGGGIGMTLNEKLRGLLLDDVIKVAEPGIYTGTESQYCIFRADELGADFGDDGPGAVRYLVTVHYFCPWDFNSIAERQALRRRLFEAGFTWPDLTDASTAEKSKSAGAEDLTQHWVLGCEYVGGLDGEVE